MLVKVGIAAGACAGFVGTIVLLNRLADPERRRDDDSGPPPTTIPLPSGDAAIGVEHLVGRTPAQVVTAYFQRDDVNDDGVVRYLGASAEGRGFRYGADRLAYREADAAGNDDGTTDLDELRDWVRSLPGIAQGPMTVSAAERFRAALPYA